MMKKLIWLGMIIGLGMVASRAYAHGMGKQHLKQVEAGPYIVSAWADPPEINTADELHITVSVQRGDELLSNATVTLIATHRDDAAEPITVAATHDNAANELFYEGSLELTTAGTWDIVIVIDEDDGRAETSFALTVKETTSNALVQVLVLIIGSVLTLGVFFLILRSRSGTKDSGR